GRRDRHGVVHASAHGGALVRRALHSAEERRLPGRRPANGTLALVEDPGAITLAGEGLNAPAAEGAALGAPDRAQVPSDARRVGAVEEDPVRVGIDDEHVRVAVLPHASLAVELAERRVALRPELGGRPIDEGDQLLGGGRPGRRLGRVARGAQPLAAEEERERREQVTRSTLGRCSAHAGNLGKGPLTTATESLSRSSATAALPAKRSPPRPPERRDPWSGHAAPARAGSAAGSGGWPCGKGGLGQPGPPPAASGVRVRGP